MLFFSYYIYYSKFPSLETEKIEVLAYGHLIQDMIKLIERYNKRNHFVLKNNVYMSKLNKLYEMCTCSIVLERPSFAEIVQYLDQF